ncbi:Flagellar motor rotation protein MotA [Candidatus Nitrotoga sp. HW29]|uniref:flagellar motor protein n=1 Tax=Candidatus Nitrotoga sp. HW29 TaxID=2886963 RepID=UPI001EF2F20A|nr:flagellar motor protein [Candidatus Nitrotoga sp. HW29]CAH1906159.1 Flagellar motor rotation protein MotA [Candidatus Nitrotoga sp. HW29]
MDKLSLAGLLLGLGGILGGQLLEGGELSILFQGAAFLIVFGGTLGAVMLQSPLNVFLAGIKMSRWVFVTPKLSPQKLIYQITGWSKQARKDGILTLEPHIARSNDLFVKKGLQLLVDGNSAEKIREALEIDNHTYEQLRFQSARIWESAAGYAPTIGILGAVLGLIHVMQSLGEPSKLGAGIAVAFISTIYGVGLANLVFLPMANKLKMLILQQIIMREILVDGLAAIASGENSRFIESKLQGFIP